MEHQLNTDALSCSTPAAFERLARQLNRKAEQPVHRLAILASFSAQFLVPYIVVASWRSRFPMEPWVGPYNQFEQLVFDTDSDLWRCSPEIVWIALRLEDVEADLVSSHAGLESTEIKRRLMTTVERIVALATAARHKTQGTIFVSNLCLPDFNHASVLGASNPTGLSHLLAEANRHLAHELTAVSDAWVFDYVGAIGECGSKNWIDSKMGYWARCGLSFEGRKTVAARLARSVAAVRRPRAKCVVVDLDNTIWGGVVGDAGVEGIEIGHEYPGNAFRDIQTFLKGLRARGILLAIASKNDESVAVSALDLHPEMVLKSADFSVRCINWGPKSASLRRIADTLNIGLDSLVFIDDNPVEREHVRLELPEVEVPEMAGEVSEWLEQLQGLESLDQSRLTAEDSQRAVMYSAEVSRTQLRRSAGTIDEFLQSLDMVAEVGLSDLPHIDRIHQLIQKTNQFNLTTRRHQKDEIRRLMQEEKSAVAWLSIQDRYGQMGVVCAGIVKDIGGGVWEVDTLIMSCRVMGRQVENAFLAFLAQVAGERGGSILRGVYIPNARNSAVRDFYSACGFAAIDSVPGSSPEGGYFDRRIDTLSSFWPAHIKRLVPNAAASPSV